MTSSRIKKMITHLPMCGLAEAPKTVLIVGGGDGGVAREVAKHDSVEAIDMVEIDEMVPHVSKRFFPELAKGFDDPRLHLKIQDGIEWVKNSAENTYDVIIVDSSDPIGPAEVRLAMRALAHVLAPCSCTPLRGNAWSGSNALDLVSRSRKARLDRSLVVQVLFERPFFEYMHRALKPGGVMCTQAESLWLHMPIIQSLAKMCRDVFAGGSIHYAFTTIPTYPSGQIGFMVCSKKSGDELVDLRRPRRAVASGTCRYYSPDVHQAAFVLPPFALTALQGSLTFQASSQ